MASGKPGAVPHRDETEGQIERLQQIFKIFGKRAQAKTCEAIRGILEEGEEIIENIKIARRLMRVCLQPDKPSSITKYRATEL